MSLHMLHASRCSKGHSSRSSSSSRGSLLQPSLACQALSSSVAHRQYKIVELHRCKQTCCCSSNSHTAAQQEQQDTYSGVVQPQHEEHQGAVVQQEQVDPSVTAANGLQVPEAGRAPAAAVASAFDAELSGQAAGDCSQGSHVGAAATASAAAGAESSSAAADSASLNACAAAAVAAEAAASSIAPDSSPADDSHSSGNPEQQQQQQEQEEEQVVDEPLKLEFYSFYQQIDEQPVPVQLPPPGCTNEPPLQRPVLAKSRYRSPSFLQHFGAPKGAAYSFMSFLGPSEWHDGKYLVSPAALDEFLLPYFNTAYYSKRRLHIAQSYQGQPYKYFQELDFPWELDISLVLDLIPKVVQIVADEACTFYGFDKSQPQPQPLLSMRTPYKVHVNFPAIFTVEASAREVRKRIINRCHCELSGLQPLLLLREEAALQQQVLQARQALQQLPQDLQESLMQHLRRVENAEGQQLLDMLQEAAALDAADVTTAATDAEVADTKTDAEAAAVAAASADPLQQLDWESIIDSPHGSLRLLGSCKAPWMDSDPAWVQEKSYSEVQLVDGVWMRQPLSYAAVQQCSILLDAMEQRVFEQSQDFLEAVYQAADSREQLLAAKRIIRSCNKVAKLLQDGGSSSIDLDSVFAQKQQQQQQQSQQSPSKRQQTQQAQQQRAAKLAKEREQKKQEALAKLQAAQAAKQQQAEAAAVAAVPTLSKPSFVRPGGIVEAPDAQQLQQQLELWRQMQEQQQELAREQQQLLLQQQQLLQALQEEDERQQQLALQAEQQRAQETLEAEQQQAAAAAEAERQRQQKKQEALAKLQAAAQKQQQQQAGGAAAVKPLLNRPGLVRPGVLPQQQQQQR